MRMLCERGGAGYATVLRRAYPVRGVGLGLQCTCTPAISSSCHFDHRTLMHKSPRRCADCIRDNEDTESLLT